MSPTPSPTEGYEIPQQLLDLRETVGQIAWERIARAGEIDRSGEYPRDIPRAAGRQHIFALPCSPSATADPGPGR